MTKISNQYSLTNVLFADAVNGRVGIGTETPSEKLSVIGNIRIDNGAADGGQLVLASSGSSDWNIDNFSGALRAYVGATERLRLTAAGNLGIGTSTPGDRLDINSGAMINEAAYAKRNIRVSSGFAGGYTTNRVQSILAGYDGSSIYATDFGYAYDGTGYSQIFSTNDNTSGDPIERMRILSNGNIGIGTSSPTSISAGYTTVDIRGASGGGLNFGTTSALGFIYADAGALDLGTYGSQVIRMYQGSNLRFIVAAASGNVSIGTPTDNGYKLNVNGSIYSSGAYFSNSSIYAAGGFSGNGIIIDYGYVVAINSNNQVASNGWYMQVSTSWSNNFRFFYGGTGVGTGSAKFQIDTGGGYTGISDINKKKDIALSTLGLAEIIQLKPSTFKFKDDVNEEEQIGFIAQEVKDIIPYAYYEDKEGDDKFIGLKQAAFIPVLVKAIQELSAQVSEQQLQINELKALLNA